MSSVYSKPIQYELNPEATHISASELNQLDVDLIDKIKVAITKLKTKNNDQVGKKKRFAKFPCALCDKNCNENQQAIFCNSCSSWVHRKCNGTTKIEYENLILESDDLPFHCMLCIMKQNSEFIPFFFLDKSELFELNGIDLPSQLSFLESYELKSKLTNMPNLHDFDMDENLIHKVNSKYYDIIEFAKLSRNTNSLSMFHVNLRSLSAHLEELQLLLKALKANFDIIGISETKEQTGGFLKNVSLDGYTIFSQHSNSSAGGVALYVKNNLDFIVREDLNALENEFETIWVELKNKKSQNVLCCCAYRHPNTEVEQFNKYMDKVMDKVSKENKLIFCMGDFNVNLLNYNIHSHTNDFVNTMISHHLLPYILHPTRVTDLSATVIDNIFSNNTIYESVSGNIMSRISDHFPQFIILNKVNMDYKNCSYAKRDYSNFDEQKFINGFEKQKMTFLEETNLPLNTKFDLFFENVSTYVDSHVPVKKMNKKDLKLFEKPWINPNIQRLMKYRDKLLRKLNRKYTPNGEYLYKKFRNRVVSELRSSRINYYNHYFTEHHSNMKLLWSGIRSIINIKNRKLYNISQLVHNGEVVQDPKDIAKIFNNYFVNIASKIDSEIPRTRKSPLDYLGNKLESSFFLSPTDSTEIECIITQLKNGKALGPYSIPCNLLKILNSFISPLLAILINESFSTGIFPDKLKIAKVIALHKKGASDNPSNYRPISLLSIFSKIFEKIMHKRLYDFLELNEVLHPLQFGFRRKHSTSHTLISMTEKIRNTIDNGNYGCGIFIDLKKAFDTVNHSILLKKLDHYGIRGIPLKWFVSYLSYRKQYVSVNGHISDELVITHGVPQGSVLGPLLFLLFINDLPGVSKFLTFYLFADDTNIYYESSDLLNIQKIVNRELRKVRGWLEANRLALNIDKTNFVIFHSQKRKLCEHIVVKIGNKKIKEESHVRFLGVLLDSPLSWEYQLIELSKKLARTTGMFYKIRHYAPKDTLVLLYHSIFASFLTYGVSVWGLTHPTLLDPISVLQKKILRVITFSDINAPSTPIFDSLKILKFNDIIPFQIVSFVYECVHSIAPTYFSGYFTKIENIHSIGTRQSNRGDLFALRCNTTQYGLRSIHYSGVRLWNSLPSEIRNSCSLSIFKRNLKQHFLAKYII